MANRKGTFIVLQLMFVILLNFSFGNCLAVSPFEDKTLAFIKNVLPIDTEYETTLSKYNSENSNTVVTYTLEANESTLDFTCVFKGELLTGCILNPKHSSVLSDRSYVDLTDAVNGFLEKYQAYTGNDLSQFTNALAEVDVTKNTTTTLEGIKLTVSSNVFDTSLRWTYTANGADYTALSITYRKGFFYALRDDRALYQIGNTEVTITKDQAIKAAMEYCKNYSYTASTGLPESRTYVQVTGFNVSEDKTQAELMTYPRNATFLFPYWRVQLSLAELYPGNVWAFWIGVWADSGEVFICNPRAVGGSSLTPNPTASATQNPTSTPTPLTTNPTPSLSIPEFLQTAIALVLTIALIGVAALIVKQRVKKSIVRE